MKRFALLAIAGLLLLSGSAYANIPHSSTGTYTSCRVIATGLVRLIDAESGASCVALTESTHTWQRGTPNVVERTYTTSGTAGALLAISQQCDSGETLLRAGYELNSYGTGTGFSLQVNRPYNSNGWWIAGVITEEDNTLKLFLTCAS